MSRPASAIFRVDASATIGGGHVMRCLTLAHQLASGGTQCLFFVNPEAVMIVPVLRKSGFQLYLVDEEDPESFVEALAKITPLADLVVFDHYDLDYSDEQKAIPFCSRILVIDDMADRRHRCNILLDQTVGRAAADYHMLVNADCTVLVGASFALLRAEFRAHRLRSLTRRADSGQMILVSMGLTDVGGISGCIVEHLVQTSQFDRINVLLSPIASSWDAVTALTMRDPRIRLHTTEAEVAELMTQADLAIGAAGTTSWERCCLGLPTILIPLANNQMRIVAELVERGAAVRARDAVEACKIAGALASDPKQLYAMSNCAAALVDGNGAVRVHEAIAALFDG